MSKTHNAAQHALAVNLVLPRLALIKLVVRHVLDGVWRLIFLAQFVLLGLVLAIATPLESASPAPAAAEAGPLAGEP